MKTLLIKLAGTVNDPSLPTFGELKMAGAWASSMSTSNYAARAFQIKANEALTLRVDGTGFFSKADYSGNLGQTLALAADTETTVTMGLGGTYNFIIPNKYAITKINHGYSFYWRNVKLADFGDMTYLEWLSLTNCQNNITGKLSDLAALSKLTQLRFHSDSTRITSITGTVKDLLHFPNLTTIDFYNCTGITGDTSEIADLHPNNGGKLATFVRDNSGITGTWPPSA